MSHLQIRCNKKNVAIMMPPASYVGGVIVLLVGVLFAAIAVEARLAPEAVSATLNHWIMQNMQSYDLRSKEIHMGINMGLLPELRAAQNGTKVISVKQDGKGDFKTISDAVNSIPSGNKHRVIIKIGKGVYKERVIVDKTRPYVTFYGDATSMPTITSSGTAAQYGTYDSATVAINAEHFMAVNIIFENTAPKPRAGSKEGQAVALKILGDMGAFYNCRFYGYQDTLCDALGRHYFRNCFIQGSLDFVFGDGRSLYENCELHSVADGLTAITAQGRSSDTDNGGFSFVHCKVTGTGRAYLSRAWKASSRVVFADTYLGELVNSKGWDDKGYTSRDSTVYYGEYNCKGPGAARKGRVKFGKLLSADEAKPFMSKTFVGGSKWILSAPSV